MHTCPHARGNAGAHILDSFVQTLACVSWKVQGLTTYSHACAHNCGHRTCDVYTTERHGGDEWTNAYNPQILVRILCLIFDAFVFASFALTKSNLQGVRVQSLHKWYGIRTVWSCSLVSSSWIVGCAYLAYPPAQDVCFHGNHGKPRLHVQGLEQSHLMLGVAPMLAGCVEG